MVGCEMSCHVRWFFPTCQVRVVRFYVSLISSLSSSLPRSKDVSEKLSERMLAEMPERMSGYNDARDAPLLLPSAPRVLCRTSTAILRDQRSLPHLNRDHPLPVFPARPPRSSAAVPCHLNRHPPRQVLPAGPQPPASVPCQKECQKIWQTEHPKLLYFE